MKKSKKVVFIICLIIVIISICGYFGINYFLSKDLENQNEDLNQAIEKYGYVEKEPVQVTVSKFNTQIMDNNLGYLASDDNLIIDNGTYWYRIYEDICLYITPEEYSKDIKKDVTSIIGIYYDKKGKNKKMALNYVKSLIKANNNELNDNEIEQLIKEARDLSSKKQMANNGKGISVRFYDERGHYEYQIKRFYK